MAEQHEPHDSDLIEHDLPEDGPPEDGLPDEIAETVPDGFDEDIYLRAFPDVAQAISDGVCTSPLQHYMEHGRHENRIAREIYRTLMLGRRIEGHIDFYGHNDLAGGWLFCGWTSEQWDEAKPLKITAHSCRHPRLARRGEQLRRRGVRP